MWIVTKALVAERKLGLRKELEVVSAERGNSYFLNLMKMNIMKRFLYFSLFRIYEVIVSISVFYICICSS